MLLRIAQKQTFPPPGQKPWGAWYRALFLSKFVGIHDAKIEDAELELCMRCLGTIGGGENLNAFIDTTLDSCREEIGRAHV